MISVLEAAGSSVNTAIFSQTVSTTSFTLCLIMTVASVEPVQVSDLDLIPRPWL